MEHKKSRWHKKRVGGTKKESVEQNQSRPGIFEESVPYYTDGTSHKSVMFVVVYMFGSLT